MLIPKHSWTPERDALAAKLWTEGGWSAAEIAAQLGSVSRNAVIGRMHRLGIKSPLADKARTRRQANTDNRLKMRAEGQMTEPKPRKSAVASPPLMRALRESTQYSPIRYLARRMHKDCATILNFGSPVEELMVCGAPIAEGSAFEFCSTCLSRFVREAEPQRRVLVVAA